EELLGTRPGGRERPLPEAASPVLAEQRGRGARGSLGPCQAAALLRLLPKPQPVLFLTSSFAGSLSSTTVASKSLCPGVPLSTEEEPRAAVGHLSPGWRAGRRDRECLAEWHVQPRTPGSHLLLPGPRLVFNRVNGRRPPAMSPSLEGTQEPYTLAHEENVRFVSEAWQQVEQQLGGGPAGESGPRPVQYVERTPNPRLQSEPSPTPKECPPSPLTWLSQVLAPRGWGEEWSLIHSSQHLLQLGSG
uniref:MAPK regulated corepressor interacting protein 2 n=1 Tax=Capra hircus TaxID=9925 RepID=A0A8C2P9W1_CAPHI